MTGRIPKSKGRVGEHYATRITELSLISVISPFVVLEANPPPSFCGRRTMRNLIIYLSALSSLSSSSAIRHGASQLRDILAFPKYEVQFLNDLPLAASDAERCGNLGIEREDEFLTGRLDIRERKRIGDGGEDPVPVSKLLQSLCCELIYRTK